MKTTFIIAFILLSISSFSQDLKYKDLNTITGKEYFDSYLSKDNFLYKVGDTITIGKPQNGKTFYSMYKTNGYSYYPKKLHSKVCSTKIVIVKIRSNKNKYKTAYALFQTTGLGRDTYNIDIETALSNGEIKHNGMTSDEALLELKRQKDKYDLGLITKEQYEQIKLNLSKIIK